MDEATRNHLIGYALAGLLAFWLGRRSVYAQLDVRRWWRKASVTILYRLVVGLATIGTIAVGVFAVWASGRMP